MTKNNCWEVLKCGREPGGAKSGELGVCSASTEKKVDGLHGGINGSRVCWAISGTLCTRKVQGDIVGDYCSADSGYSRTRHDVGFGPAVPRGPLR